MSFIFGRDDEFEEEPEDELASAGMHVVEHGDDAIEDAPAADEGLEEVAEDAVVIEDEDADEAEKDEAPDGLAELAELEKDVITPLTFGSDDEE